ncbi:MAG: GNAT family N-acetyltransferase [Patescibacteria group bacterium]
MKQTLDGQPLIQDESVENVLTTRPATEADYEFALKTHHDAYEDVVSKSRFGWDVAKQDEFFRNCWAPATYQIILADGTEVGYCNVEYEGDHLLLDELVISPKFEGKGIGTRILKQIIQRAITENKLLRLQVLKNNDAKRLYDRSGFKEIKEEETDTHYKMIFDPNLEV